MDISTRLDRHAGGTSTPTRWVRVGSPTGIFVWCALYVVPHRALPGALANSRTAESRGSCGLCPVRGTEGHDGPRQVVRVHGRAR